MNEFKLIITGTIRSKKNHRQIFGGGKNKINLPPKAYLDWERYAQTEILPQIGSFRSKHRFKLPLSCPVAIEAHFYYKGNQLDLSAAFEALADCLQHMVYEDDKQIMSWDGSRLHHDLKNPRTEVTIRWEEDLNNLPF